MLISRAPGRGSFLVRLHITFHSSYVQNSNKTVGGVFSPYSTTANAHPIFQQQNSELNKQEGETPLSVYFCLLSVNHVSPCNIRAKVTHIYNIFTTSHSKDIKWL